MTRTPRTCLPKYLVVWTSLCGWSRRTCRTRQRRQERPIDPFCAASPDRNRSPAAQATVELSTRWSAPLTLVHVLAPVKVPARWQPLVQESEAMRVAFGSCGAQRAGPATVWYARLRTPTGSRPSIGNDWLD